MDKQINMFPIGSVVYYIKDDCTAGDNRYSVDFGIVNGYLSSREIQIEMYDVCECRTINNIPVQNIVTPTRWRKLPKGWSIGKPLVKRGSIKLEDKFPEASGLNISNPKDVLNAISMGLYVKVKDKDYGSLEVELGSMTGWRLVRNYGKYQKTPPSYKTLRLSETYASYEEAKAVINDIHKEWERQANLSDEEWSIEQIDQTLDRWAGVYRVPVEIKHQYRQWLMELDNIEEVETRVYMGDLQWKYWKNKTWNSIVLPV